MNQKYVYIVSLAHFFCDIAMGALPAILPFFILNYGMDYSAVAGFMFASSFLSSLVQPTFGWLADHTSITWLMPLGIFLAGSAMGFSGLLENYWAIFAVLTVSGIGSAIFHPEAARMIHKLSGSKRGTALSIFSVGGNGGFAVGPIIAVAAITAFGMKGTLVFGLLAIIMAISLIVIGPKMKTEIAANSSLEDIETSNDVERKNMNKNDWPSFARLTLLIAFSSIVVCGLRSFIPLYLVNVTGISTAAAGSALTLLFMFGVITTLIGGFLADRIGYLKIVQFSYLLLAPMIGLLSQTTDAFLCFVLMIPIGFAMFSPFSSVVVLGQNYLAKSVGFASGVTLGLYFSMGGIFVPLIGGFADIHGLPATMELLTAFAFMTALCTFFLPKPVIDPVI
ncbi:MAG: MFS transporter [Negativicutes bacterium]|nr:MFS transporter [Negativicutes bacterium]